jgi:O-antigen ligase
MLAAGARLRTPADRLAVIALGACAVLAVAALASGVGGEAGVIVAVGIALAPIALYVALRYPLIFPFPLYLALVPYDQILQLGSTGVTITRIAGLVSGAALLFHMLVSRRVVAPPRGWYAWAAVVLWMALTALWTIDPPETGRVLAISLQSFALFTILAFYPIRPVELKVTLWAIVASALGTAFLIFHFYSLGYRLGGNRITIANLAGAIVDPNHLAANFMLPIAVVLASIVCARRFRSGLALVPVFGVLATGILLSGSRGGLIACAVVPLYLAARARRLWAMLLGGGIVLALSFLVPTAWERFADPTLGAGSGRLGVWHIGLHALHDHWIIGAGIGAFPAAYDQAFLSEYTRVFDGWYRPSHNLLLGASVELGVIGLALILVAWYLTVRDVRTVPQTSEFYPARLAAETALIALFVVALLVDALLFKYVWFAFAFAAMVRNASRSEIQTRPAVGGGPGESAPKPNSSTLRKE